MGSDLYQMVGIGVEVGDKIANVARMRYFCAKEVTVTFPSHVCCVICYWIKRHFEKIDGYAVVLGQKPRQLVTIG